MQSDTLLHVANFSTLFICMVLKFPQIFVLMRAETTAGVSLNSLLLELIGFIVFVTYQMFHDYPPATYLEYPILIAQDVVLLLLLFRSGGRWGRGLVCLLLLAGGWRLLMLDQRIIDTAMGLCTFISAASKVAQLQCLWRTKEAEQVSALTWAMASYTCLARIYTTAVTTGDTQVLVRFVVITVLNLWVLLTVVHYQRRSRTSKKED